jgi:hypothetical protein
MIKILLSFLIIGIIISCTNNKEIIPDSDSVSQFSSNARVGATNTIEGPIELGKKLTNPYSLQNMSKALIEIQKTKPEYKTKKIDATHNYVRIESLTEDALWAIQDKEDIDIFIYPLDYEVIKSGNTYKEKDKITKYQVYWAAVPIDYKFGKDIKIDLLEKLYLPKGTRPEENSVNRSISDPFLDDIEDKSLTMFDPKYIKPNKKAKPMANVNPSGTLRVYDDFKNTMLPIEGLTIRGKRWFTTIYTPTNSLGTFQFQYTFNGPVDLSFDFESAKYELRMQVGSNNYAPITLGIDNVTTTPWNLDFYGVAINANLPPNYQFNPVVWRLAHTWRAAYTYYYKNSNWSLQAPPQPNAPVLGLLNNLFTLTTKLKIGINDDPLPFLGFSHTWMTTGIQGGVHIVLVSCPFPSYISTYNNNTYNYTGLDIFGTTIHELTHAQHFEFGLNKLEYLNSNAKSMLAETYALAVEYRITMDEYNIKNSTKIHENILTVPREYDYKKIQERGIESFKDWDNRTRNAYTGACIDLMDTHNQGYTIVAVPFSPIRIPDRLDDYASGVSIKDIQTQLKNNPRDWKAFKLGLIGIYPFKTTEINSIFNAYAKWDTTLH